MRKNNFKSVRVIKYNPVLTYGDGCLTIDFRATSNGVLKRETFKLPVKVKFTDSAVIVEYDSLKG